MLDVVEASGADEIPSNVGLQSTDVEDAEALMENETGAADFEASDTVDDADADEGEGPPIKSTVEPQSPRASP